MHPIHTHISYINTHTYIHAYTKIHTGELCAWHKDAHHRCNRYPNGILGTVRL